jgi:hypothetical protein
MATPSNCGNYLKLRLPTHHGNMDGGRGNDLGYGKNGEDIWSIRSQAPKGTISVYGEGSETKWRWAERCDCTP